MEASYILFIIFVVAFILILIKNNSNEELFSEEDKKIAENLARELEDTLANGGEVPTLDDFEFEKVADNVYIMKVENKEGMSYPDSGGWWPYHYYVNRYSRSNLYNKLYQWSPSFYTTSHWMWRLRPGLALPHEQSGWVRHNGQYYYLNNSLYYPSGKITSEPYIPPSTPKSCGC